MKRQEAIARGGSMYQLFVKSPGEAKVLLRRVSAAKNNHKMAGTKHKVWRAGAFKGMPLYQLSLEERATCPVSCSAWDICYGNNMPFAMRVNPMRGFDEFYTRLEGELDILDKKHPEGYSLRLHVLGDFFSVEYVIFWDVQLRRRPALHIYGYTHRTDEIGDAIERLWLEFGARFNILQSDGDKYQMPSALLEGTPGSELLPTCPEQTGKANGCLDCGLCTLPRFKGVTFLKH